jgi:hypothetical protein
VPHLPEGSDSDLSDRLRRSDLCKVPPGSGVSYIVQDICQDEATRGTQTASEPDRPVQSPPLIDTSVREATCLIASH